MKKTRATFILDDLCSKIYSHAFSDDKLPTQRELSEFYGCSRFTIQQVLKQLEILGLVEQVQGSGIYINNHRLSMPAVYNSLMRTSYDNLNSRMLYLKKVSAGSEISQIFGLPENAAVWEFCRVRTALGEYAEIETAWMPYDKFRDLSKTVIETSIQIYVLKKGLKISHQIKKYSAVNLTNEEAQLLYCKRGQASMEIISRSVLDNGEVFEYSRAVTQGYSCMYLMPFDREDFEYRKR